LAALEPLWSLRAGQNGVPPLVAPVNITLTGSRRSIYLEGYQKATFNHVWAQAVCEKAWAAVVVDRAGGDLGTTTNWGSGGRAMPCNLSFNDCGPYGNSLQPGARFREEYDHYFSSFNAPFELGVPAMRSSKEEAR